LPDTKKQSSWRPRANNQKQRLHQERKMEGITKMRAGLLLAGLVFCVSAPAQQTFVTPSTNTNIIGVTPDPANIRDLGLKQQQEPSCVVRPGNESFIFCAYNDLRAADQPSVQGDSWMGVSMSNDAGQTWYSRLAPGYLGHPNSIGMGFAADPGVVAIPGNSPGLAVLNYIAAFRDSDDGVLAIQRWVEYPQEDQDFWKAEDEIYIVADGSEGRFIDKPAFFYLIDDLNQQGVINEDIYVEGESAPVSVQTPTGTLIVVYAVFTGNSGGAKLLLRKSYDNGKTWTNSIKISEEQNEVTGVSVTAVGQDFVVVYRRRGDNNDSDAILSAFCKNDGNQKCTKGSEVFEVCPFDQPASGSTFRTFSFPWAANDGNRFYAFAAHRTYPDASCAPISGAPGLFAGKPRIVGMSSADGKNWVGAAGNEDVPFQVAPRDDGFQLMPVAFGTKGRIDIAWYDTFREEDIGLPGGPNDLLVNDYNTPDGLSRVFRKADVWMTRLTAPGCSNNANAGCTPSLESPVRVSQYAFAVDLANPAVGAETEAHLPNLTLYKSGTLAFNGDYIALSTPPFRENAAGKWIPNSLPGGSNELPGFTDRQDLFVAWGDNRDVRADLPALDSGTQLPYTPPFNSPANPGGPAAELNKKFDPEYERPGEMVAEDEPDDDPLLPSDIGVCQVGSFDFSRSRDSNVYSSLVRDEPSLVAPTPTKPLGTIQRMFPVIITNIDEFNSKDFCLEIANQPLDYPSSPGSDGNGIASFYQLPAYAPFQQGQEVDLLDVSAGPGSSASRAVFVTTNNGASVITVNAYKDSCPAGPGESFGDLINSVQLADGDLFDPVFCQDNPSDPACDLVSTNETHDINFAAPVFQTPVFQAPAFQTPGFQTPVLQTPSFQTPAFQTPSFQTPGFQTPVFQTPVFQTPVFQTPSFQTPVFQTPSFQTPSFQTGSLIGDTAVNSPQDLVYQDIHYPVNANANVTTTFSADIALNGLNPEETAVQLIAWTPNTYATSVDCVTQPIANQQIIAYTDLDASSLQSVNLPTTFSANNQNPYAGEISFFGQPGKDISVTVRIWAAGMAKQNLLDRQVDYQDCLAAGGGEECEIQGVRGLVTFGASAHGCRTDDAIINTQNPDGTDCLNNGNEKILEDRLPPEFNIEPDITIEVEADLPEGAEVDLTGPGIVSATDQGEGLPVVCWEVAPDGTETELPDIFDIGNYAIRCEAVDPAGNVGSVELIVDVTDSVPPVITLNGDTDPTVEAGTPFTDLGYSASDTRGSTVIPLIATVTGGVDTGVLGLQTITYTVTDTGGNTVVAMRNVTVVDTIAPVLSGVPAPMPGIEASGPDGASVTWPLPTADDAFEGTVLVSCSPSSGSLFSFGTTTVTCSASDASGNTTSATFDVTVNDTLPPTPPVLPGSPTPLDIVVEATGASGAVVNWSVLTMDTVDPNPTVACVPSSGSTFGITTTPVLCTSTDSAGNSSVGGFDVIVQDTTAPTYSALPDLNREATDPAGTVVNYGAIVVTDIVDGTFPAGCTPPSGSAFPIGSTTVNCSATDVAGNNAIASFAVIVGDTTPPVVTASNIEIDALSGGIDIEVDYVTDNVFVTDAGDGDPELSCAVTNPDSNIVDDGMTATITGYGSWAVSCIATDSSGNESAPANFNITVAFPWGIEIDRLKGRINAGSTVPLDWRYFDPDTGLYEDSSMIVPKVEWTGPFSDSACTTGNTNTGDGEDSGSSYFRYSHPTWQFNWQTPPTEGYYELVISPPGFGFPDATMCVRTR